MTAHLSQRKSEGTIEILVPAAEDVRVAVPRGFLPILYEPAISCIRYLKSVAARKLLVTGVWEKGEFS